MSIVMGLDQHRGQITGEWIGPDTGELQRTRVAPAERAHVRKWLSRFRGKELQRRSHQSHGVNGGRPALLFSTTRKGSATGNRPARFSSSRSDESAYL